MFRLGSISYHPALERLRQSQEGIQGHSWVHSEFEDSLGYMKLTQKKKKSNVDRLHEIGTEDILLLRCGNSLSTAYCGHAVGFTFPYRLDAVGYALCMDPWL